MASAASGVWYSPPTSGFLPQINCAPPLAQRLLHPHYCTSESSSPPPSYTPPLSSSSMSPSSSPLPSSCTPLPHSHSPP
ncbi:hypothetical protein GUJ93_ZPchr0005g16364 [Zizania palustris]|uniref:Uncharacterized protein n=1 Tax=Zizania palustris TaxID=103762 RepID=A0A8J5SSP5_ZIZPA|nr:hypothetical protein GUJ93_ZPchr0005g16364 [Zizania palustris]